MSGKFYQGVARGRMLTRASVVTICVLLLVASGEYRRPGAAAWQDTSGVKLKLPADMLVVKGATGDVIYAADSSAGAIFYLENVGREQREVPYDDFKLLVRTTPGFRKPAGLAYRQGKLVGCDPEANACFEIDPKAEDKTPRAIHSPGLVREPKYVAASEDGALAVSSDKQVQYFTPGVQNARSVVREMGDIDRINFDGRNLIVLEEEGAGELYGFDATAAGAKPEALGVSDHPKYLPAGVRSLLPDLKDFALFRGVYYVAGKEELFVVARPQPNAVTEPTVLPLQLRPEKGRGFNRIAVSEESVYASDEGRGVLLVAPRPVPVTVEFPNASGLAAEQQVTIIESLQKTGAMLPRTVRARSIYDTVNDFVSSELLAKPQPGASTSAAGVSRLAGLVCKLNGWDCETSPAKQRGQGELFFRKDSKIGGGHEFLVPSAVAKGYEVDKIKQGDGKYAGLDIYLSKRGIIPLTAQPAALAPGTIVRVDGEQHPTTSPAGKCEAAESVTSSPTFIPSDVHLEPEKFARQLGSQATTLDFRRLGIDDVVARYADVKFERLELGVAEKKSACARAAAEPGTYVVDRVLVSSAARYIFFGRNGNPVSPDAKRLAALGLAGVPDPTTRGWSQSSRLVLGYTAFSLTPGETPQDMEVAYLKPLPATTRVYVEELTLLVESAKLREVLQELNRMAEQSRERFYAFSNQDYELEGGKSLGRAAAGPSDQLQAALSSRNTLRELIHFPRRLSEIDLGDLNVGVVDDLLSFDERHRCFFDDAGRWSWGDDPPPPAPPANLKDYHGTKVAAVIGAKSGLPGLVPTVRLVKINAESLESEMEANERDVHIYNVSLHLKQSKDLDTLVNRLDAGQVGDRNVLFVVAAGNEGTDYGGVVASSVEAPVSWQTKLSGNVIVVGASTNSPNPQRLPQTNYSKKYVQLFAPGESVYTAAMGHDYGPDSGSSLAAPQVTAVAALLRLRLARSSWIKAVLIYSADWSESLADDVWGGVLNAEKAWDAVSDRPNNIYFPDETGAGEVGPMFARLKNEARATITIKKGAVINDPSTKKALARKLAADKTLPFKDILRIQRLGGGSYRVIYLDKGTGTMQMVYNAAIESSLKCIVTTDASGNAVSGDACAKFAEGAKEGEITFNTIKDYVARPRPEQLLVRFPKAVD